MADLCGQPHEAPGLAYLGACVAEQDHDGPHEFVGPLEGTVISVTLGDGWTRTRTDDRPEHLLEPGLNEALEGLGKALASHGHWRVTYDQEDGEPYGEVCQCPIGEDHDGTGAVVPDLVPRDP